MTYPHDTRCPAYGKERWADVDECGPCKMLAEEHPYAPDPHQTPRPAVGVYPDCAVCRQPYWSALHPISVLRPSLEAM